MASQPQDSDQGGAPEKSPVAGRLSLTQLLCSRPGMWLCPLLPVLVGALCEAALPGPTGWRLPGKSPRFDRPGDVVVGGSFSIFPFNNVTLFDFTAPPAGLPSSE